MTSFYDFALYQTDKYLTSLSENDRESGKQLDIFAISETLGIIFDKDIAEIAIDYFTKYHANSEADELIRYLKNIGMSTEENEDGK